MTKTTMNEYKREVSRALDDDFQRRMLESFAASYRVGRAAVFEGKDVRAAIADVAARKDDALRRRGELFARFRERAEELGVTVHRATDAPDACAIVARIAKDEGCRKIIKSKSMTAEEIRLNPALEREGFEVVESDLGEWILQLRNEGPSHMVMPAIHLSRGQVARTFAAGAPRQPAPDPDDITALVRLARRELRRHFAEADMGISGANFVLAENGAVGLVTNEGNARLVTTLPRVHVVLCGLDKLVDTADDALTLLNVLPRNATGQHLTSYISWIRGAAPGEREDGKPRAMHVVFVDNGRSDLARDPVFSQVLRCVRCGACANVCPIYRMVGGHSLGQIYIGAIGLVLTWFFHDRERAKALLQNCVGCGACRDVCGAGIDLPRLIEALRNRVAREDAPLSTALLARMLSSRRVFHGLLRAAAKAQGPFTEHTPFVRHLPEILARPHGYRALPALADVPFRDRWPDRKPVVTRTRFRVALFAGCLQDFVYPEQLDAALAVFARYGADVDFPLDQTCCGLPLIMLGRPTAAADLARRNVRAFARLDQYDAIVTLCASCASHLKNGYANLLDREAEAFSAKVTDFSSFTHDILGVDERAGLIPAAAKTVYHAPCHLCRGLGVHEAPRALLRAVGSYVPTPDEESCCGFGGTYTVKFPELSAELMNRKLDAARAENADTLVTDCPGCILHLRGGAERRGLPFRVLHMAEALAESLPKL
ncbi:MAG: LUD domain-containing protein [Desulfovibrionaceae bacterium]|nr:LUD domain-containing protein [Desulfovibrionaceae bacterium]